ncbi:MAG: hypothetical protein KJ823_00900 [Proteobacteria bacterium]|nr:hypothetical protein [Pseudomonadota bacterium]
MFTKILSQNGYQTNSAEDEFVANIKVTEFKPGLLILDVFMTEIDGLEVCNEQ